MIFSTFAILISLSTLPYLYGSECLHVVVLHKSGSSALNYNVLKSLYPQCVNDDSKSISPKLLSCETIVNFFRDGKDDRTDIPNMIQSKECDNCKYYLQIRHPLDVMVSMYNSYTTSNHMYPKWLTKEQISKEKAYRAKEHAMGVDGYAVEYFRKRVVAAIERHIEIMHEARDKFKCDLYMGHYESFVSSPKEWANVFKHFAELKPKQIQRLNAWAEAQAKIVVNGTRHTTYVYPGSHLKLLQPSTIVNLYHNLTDLSPILVKYSGYF